MSARDGSARSDRPEEDLSMHESMRWPAFAGIDWGGDHHQLCVLDPTGVKQLELRVPHDVAGLRQLDGELARFASVIPVAIERSEGLLVEHLQAQGHVVFAVSPRIASGEELAEHLMAPAGEAVEQVTDTAAEAKQAVADTAKGRRREHGDSSSGGGHRLLRGDR
jgi:hypothetical protein